MTERPFSAYQGEDPYIFVSYAHDDADIVYPELIQLKEAGFNIWYDEGIAPGSTWSDEVALALTQSKLFLYFITPNSMASDNCHQELNFALSRERKILAVHLLPTELSMGIELRLSNKQAILKRDHSESAYRQKLNEAIKDLLPQFEPVASVLQKELIVNRKSIAILPFTNRNLDQENDYLCDGIAEELIVGLSSLDDLDVASQLSSFGLKGQNLDVTSVGVKLKVANVLAGSIQKSGDRVRIHVTLNESEKGKVLWSERYDGTLEDVFDLQETVARQVVDALKVKLEGNPDQPLIDVGTKSMEAYQAYLKGKKEYEKQTRSGYLAAHDHFSKAVEIDPDFGQSWHMIFLCYTTEISFQWYDSLEGHMSRARDALNQLEATGYQINGPRVWGERLIDRSLIPDQKSEALENISAIKTADDRWKGFQFYRLSINLIAAGLLNGAEKYFEYYFSHINSRIALSMYDNQYGNLLFSLGRFEKAIDHITNALATHPDSTNMLGNRAMLFSRTGQYQKAEQDLIDLEKTFSKSFPQFYDLYWRRDMDGAKAYFKWLESRKNLASIFKSWGCLMLGQTEKGVDYLLQYTVPVDHIRNMLYPLTPSIKREVTSHPEFRAYLAKYGLDDAWRDELMEMVNELEPITGIHVSLDEDY